MLDSCSWIHKSSHTFALTAAGLAFALAVALAITALAFALASAGKGREVTGPTQYTNQQRHTHTHTAWPSSTCGPSSCCYVQPFLVFIEMEMPSVP